MEFNELIRERFSCRALSDKEIPHESYKRANGFGKFLI